jgi:pyruvate decarboxylase
LTKNAASRQAYERIKGPAPEPESGDMQRPLTTARLTTCVQAMLDGNSNLVAEVGDSWLNGLKMRLPEGARFEFQMQWGAIGWAVPAVLGYSIGLPPSRRVIALIGDGSFQVSAQEVSTMIRYNANPILFLINNGGYTIEAEIHDGPYNTIKNWDYAGLVDVFNDKEGTGWSARVDNELALKEAIVRALGHDGPSMIECIIARNDCSKQLLVWGSRVAEANARPPRV